MTGNMKKYCCGGGQSTSVDRRVLIYETIGGVSKQPRAPRWDEIVSILAKAVIPSSTPTPTATPTVTANAVMETATTTAVDIEKLGKYGNNNGHGGIAGVRRILSDNSRDSSQPQRKLVKMSSTVNSDIVNTEEHGTLQVLFCYC